MTTSGIFPFAHAGPNQPRACWKVLTKRFFSFLFFCFSPEPVHCAQAAHWWSFQPPGEILALLPENGSRGPKVEKLSSLNQAAGL